jgi:hypothetical protein
MTLKTHFFMPSVPDQKGKLEFMSSVLRTYVEQLLT